MNDGYYFKILLSDSENRSIMKDKQSGGVENC